MPLLLQRARVPKPKTIRGALITAAAASVVGAVRIAASQHFNNVWTP
jgi:hypothetical protein